MILCTDKTLRSFGHLRACCDSFLIATSAPSPIIKKTKLFTTTEEIYKLNILNVASAFRES